MLCQCCCKSLFSSTFRPRILFCPSAALLSETLSQFFAGLALLWKKKTTLRPDSHLNYPLPHLAPGTRALTAASCDSEGHTGRFPRLR